MRSQDVFGLEDRQGGFTLFTSDPGLTVDPGPGFVIFKTLGIVDGISEETDQFGAVGKVSTLGVVINNSDKKLGQLIFKQANLFNLNRVFVYEVFNGDWATKSSIFSGKIDSMVFSGTEIKFNLR